MSVISDEYTHELINLYFDEENFSLSQTNLDLFNKLIEILSQLTNANFFEFETTGGIKRIKFILDFNQLEIQKVENASLLQKLLQNFGEQTYIFIRIIFHRMLKEKEKDFNIKIPNIPINLEIRNSDYYFRISSNDKLKYNSFVEFYGRIIKFSNVKQLNTKMKITR